MTYAPPRIEPGRPDERQMERAVEAVREALARLRFGAIALTIHDGRVVQMEVIEKQRF